MHRKERRPRRVKVIDARLQYGMIAVFLAVVVAGLLLFSAVAALLSFVAGAGESGAAFVSRVLPWLLLNDLAIMVLVIVVGIFATHRVAGPVYRMERDIERVLAGERGVTIRLRRTDAFPGLARRVNQLIGKLEHTRKP